MNVRCILNWNYYTTIKFTNYLLIPLAYIKLSRKFSYFKILPLKLNSPAKTISYFTLFLVNREIIATATLTPKQPAFATWISN